MSCCIVYGIIDGSIQIVAGGIDETSDAVNNLISGLPDTVSYFFSEDAVDLEKHWVNSGVLEDKTDFDITVQGAVIFNVPANTTVTWPDGEMTLENDGTIEMESNVTGVFEIFLSHAQHFPLTAEVQSNG